MEYKEVKGKARVDLVDPEFILGIAEILGFGAEKYEPYSFQKVDNALDKYYAAAMRHLLKWRAGDVIDEESGKDHLLHTACNLMFILRLQHKEIGPLMSVVDTMKMESMSSECENNMGEPGPTEKRVDGGQADHNEGSDGRASESEDFAVPVDCWS